MKKKNIINNSTLSNNSFSDVIKIYIQNYNSLIKDKNNKEIDENNFENYPLDYFVISNNDKNSLLEIYNDFIQRQNEFISTIKKSKIHENFLKNIDEIYVQDANESDIPKLCSEAKLIEIILTNAYKEYNFDKNNNIKYDNCYRKIIFNYDKIEKTLGNNIYSGIKKFIPSNIGVRKMKYKDEKYNEIDNDILYDFQKKYEKAELNENEKQNIQKFLENKNKNYCYSFLISMQFFMIYILSKSSVFKKEDDLFRDVIEKMPLANMDKTQKEDNNIMKSFLEFTKNSSKIDDDDILALMNMENEANSINYSINKLLNIFEIANEIYVVKD